MSRLRIGIVTDRLDGLQNWQLKLVDSIFRDDRFDLCTVLVVAPAAAAVAPALAFSLLCALEAKVFARQAPFRADAAMARLKRTTRIELAVPALAVKSALAGARLDVAVRLSGRSLPDELLADMAFGEWSLSFVEQHCPSGDWTAFQEALDRAPLTEVQLRVRTGKAPHSAAIAKASYNTKFSAARNAAVVKEKSVILMMRELRRIADTRVQQACFAVSPNLSRPPNLVQTARYAWRFGTSLARRLLAAGRSLAGGNSGSWAVRIGTGTMDSFAPAETVELPLADGLWAADPFLFHHDGHDYLFFECYPNNRAKAWIAVARIEKDRAVVLGQVLRQDYHLSYPFIFRHGGEIFMIPETHQTNRVEVWRCVEFPLRWELHATALEGCSPVDTVMFEHEGAWWMLTSLSDHHAFPEHCSELYAFCVDGPQLRSVVPHKRNPVVIGSAVARNAGRVVKANGRLLRPSQCNSHGIYGRALNIMEIQRLDRESYIETPLRLIAPDFEEGLIGCHHIDALDGRVVIDVCKA